jgi:hypothetical protein
LREIRIDEIAVCVAVHNTLSSIKAHTVIFILVYEPFFVASKTAGLYTHEYMFIKHLNFKHCFIIGSISSKHQTVFGSN